MRVAFLAVGLSLALLLQGCAESECTYAQDISVNGSTYKRPAIENDATCKSECEKYANVAALPAYASLLTGFEDGSPRAYCTCTYEYPKSEEISSPSLEYCSVPCHASNGGGCPGPDESANWCSKKLCQSTR
eukprot:TRINITY_DN116643_c0_g1_i1.p1 TRINITY_DN116643_c0_g1~~TRINITY_DN116643_c0_g1_i1.p1  ORF type:complete len:132 (-),score=15.44 TRINITY_DN116643_c0_g1_i1:82-477(-)